MKVPVRSSGMFAYNTNRSFQKLGINVLYEVKNIFSFAFWFQLAIFEVEIKVAIKLEERVEQHYVELAIHGPGCHDYDCVQANQEIRRLTDEILKTDSQM